MIKLEKHVAEAINRPDRIGIVATADREGRSNIAYFGSVRALPDNGLILTLGQNRTLANLEQNTNAVFMAIESASVTGRTQGWRLYLTVREFYREGKIFDAECELIAKEVGEKAAAFMKAAVVFDIVEVRPLMDFKADKM